MAISFRKSKKVGPFRINFSNSGIGVSAGVKGARISMNSSGTYVQLGSNGIYYRKKISSPKPQEKNPVKTALDESASITTINFDELTDVESQDFIKELEEKDRKLPFLKWLGIIPFSILLFSVLIWSCGVINTREIHESFFNVSKDSLNIRQEPSLHSKIIRKTVSGQRFRIIDSTNKDWMKIRLPKPDSVGYIASSIGTKSEIVTVLEIRRFDSKPWVRSLILLGIIGAAIPWCIYMHKLDKKRRTLELYYSMDDKLAQLYDDFLNYFSELASSKRIWQKTHSEKAENSKYSGGATSLVRRNAIKKIVADSDPSPFLKTNVEIPHISLQNIDLYFLPERLLLKRGNKFAAVYYRNINIDIRTQLFIEEEGVTSDAIVVDHTWKYVNKSGGPDMRFKDNIQLPICQYSQYSFSSSEGINEIILTSKLKAGDFFFEFITLIGEIQSKLNTIN